MMSEKEQVWDRLKNGVPVITSTVQFTGNGVATKFNSAWLLGQKLVRVTVDNVAQSNLRDFRIIFNDIIFKVPPVKDSNIHVEVHT